MRAGKAITRFGECLCGGVAFELNGEMPKLYQCHCSLCRKVTGAAANAAMIVERGQFRWVLRTDNIRQYVTESGFKSNFCKVCGSPLPNLTRADTAYWIPVGLLRDDAGLELGAQLFVASRASWDRIADAGEHFDEMPAADALDGLLKPAKSV